MSEFREVLKNFIRKQLAGRGAGAAAAQSGFVTSVNEDGTVTVNLTAGMIVNASNPFQAIQGIGVAVIQANGVYTAIPTSPVPVQQPFAPGGYFQTLSGTVRIASVTKLSNGNWAFLLQDSGSSSVYVIDSGFAAITVDCLYYPATLSPNGQWVGGVFGKMDMSVPLMFVAFNVGKKLTANGAYDAGMQVYYAKYSATQTLGVAVPSLMSGVGGFLQVAVWGDTPKNVQSNYPGSSITLAPNALEYHLFGTPVSLTATAAVAGVPGSLVSRFGFPGLWYEIFFQLLSGGSHSPAWLSQVVAGPPFQQAPPGPPPPPVLSTSFTAATLRASTLANPTVSGVVPGAIYTSVAFAGVDPGYLGSGYTKGAAAIPITMRNQPQPSVPAGFTNTVFSGTVFNTGGISGTNPILDGPLALYVPAGASSQPLTITAPPGFTYTVTVSTPIPSLGGFTTFTVNGSASVTATGTTTFTIAVVSGTSSITGGLNGGVNFRHGLITCQGPTGIGMIRDIRLDNSANFIWLGQAFNNPPFGGQVGEVLYVNGSAVATFTAGDLTGSNPPTAPPYYTEMILDLVNYYTVGDYKPGSGASTEPEGEALVIGSGTVQLLDTGNIGENSAPLKDTGLYTPATATSKFYAHLRFNSTMSYLFLVRENAAAGTFSVFKFTNSLSFLNPNGTPPVGFVLLGSSNFFIGSWTSPAGESLHQLLRISNVDETALEITVNPASQVVSPGAAEPGSFRITSPTEIGALAVPVGQSVVAFMG